MCAPSLIEISTSDILGIKTLSKTLPERGFHESGFKVRYLTLNCHPAQGMFWLKLCNKERLTCEIEMVCTNGCVDGDLCRPEPFGKSCRRCGTQEVEALMV
jgi:hypothetical protein